MRRIVVLVSLVFLVFLQSCEEENPETTILVTEEVLLTSGEQARLLGRLITNQSINPTDHGFYLSLDENFSSPIIISLGPKEGPGRFIGEVTGLEIDQRYFAKAFMDIGNGVEFGNTIELATLNPGIDSYFPGFGEAGTEVSILGKNFTSDTRVFFGDQEAQVVEIVFESRITVLVPQPSISSTTIINVQSQDRTISFSAPFEYQTGSYTKLGEFPGSPIRLFDNISYVSNGSFHIGLGSSRVSNSISFYEQIQRYNVSTDQWQEVNFPGSNRVKGFATSNYLGGGGEELGRDEFEFNRSFWRNTGSGFVRLDDLPFGSWNQIAAELNNTLYLIGGEEGETEFIRSYNSASGTWENLGNTPQSFSTRNANFVYENRLYIVSDAAELFRYDPQGNSWDIINTYPGSLGQGYGFGQVSGSKAYVGGYRRSSEVWELNLENFNWVSKTRIPGLAQDVSVGSFADNGFVYLLRQPDLSVSGFFPIDLYRLDPNGL